MTCEADRVVVDRHETGAVLRAFETGRETTHMVALTPDGRKLFATDLGGGMLTAIDLDQGKAVAQVATGAGFRGN